MAEYNLWCILGKHVCYHWEIFCLYLKCWEGNRLILAIESECSCVYVSLSQRHSHYSLNTNTWKLMAITNKSGKRRERLWKGCLLKESSVQLPAKHFLGGWLDTFFLWLTQQPEHRETRVARIRLWYSFLKDEGENRRSLKKPGIQNMLGFWKLARSWSKLPSRARDQRKLTSINVSLNLSAKARHICVRVSC